MSNPIRILVADDHAIVRDGLTAILGTQADMMVVGQAGDGKEACMLFDKLAPDILLLDLRMPKMDGLEVVRQIHSQAPCAQIVIVTTYDNDEDISLALRAGAQGYLLKDSPRQQIWDAIRQVHAGRRFIPAGVATKIAENVGRPELTGRELQVLRQVAQGASNKEIGSALFITEGTVKSHVKKILGKLDAASRTEAVAIASRRGLVKM